MKYQYRTHGTCSQLISFEIENGKLHNVEFFGGCQGNLRGISRLVEGQDAANVAQILKGTLCHDKGTSCPDQLSCAIDAALKQAE